MVYQEIVIVLDCFVYRHGRVRRRMRRFICFCKSNLIEVNFLVRLGIISEPNKPLRLIYKRRRYSVDIRASYKRVLHQVESASIGKGRKTFVVRFLPVSQGAKVLAHNESSLSCFPRMADRSACALYSQNSLEVRILLACP